MSAGISSGGRLRRLAWCAMVAALTAGVAACDGYNITAGTGRFADVGGSPVARSDLVGTWQRAFFFLDQFGFANGTETTWVFNSDGSAIRFLVTSNFTLGVADTIVSEARFSTSGTDVTIDFISPSPGRVVLDYRFSGTQLVLAGEPYRRIAN